MAAVVGGSDSSRDESDHGICAFTAFKAWHGWHDVQLLSLSADAKSTWRPRRYQSPIQHASDTRHDWGGVLFIRLTVKLVRLNFAADLDSS